MTEKLESGHSVALLKNKEDEHMKKKYYLYTDGGIKLHPGNWSMPLNFKKIATELYNFKVQPSDIFVVTFPKSGTTWTQEVVWNLVFNPDLDNPMSEASLDMRFPNFDADMSIATTGAPVPDPNGDPMKMFEMLFPGKSYKDNMLLKLSSKLPNPRTIKTHLPLCFLPKDSLKSSRIIYVLRDPRDVLTSFYHYVRLQVLWGFRGTLDEFIDDVINDRAPFCPYWSHVKLAWESRHQPNVLLVHFEDLKLDPIGEVKRIDKFLGTNRTLEQIQNISRFTNFENMKERAKKNPPTSNDNQYFNQDVVKKEGGFFRKGQIGDWKNRFSEEQAEKIHNWMAKNLSQFGDEFKYKI